MYKLILILFFFYFNSCGINEANVLDNPPVPDSSLQATNKRSLYIESSSSYHNSNPSFRGYEFYYKIYPSSNQVYSGWSSHNSFLSHSASDEAYIEAQANSLSALKSRDYVRLELGPFLGREPLIRISDGDRGSRSLRINIDFNSLYNPVGVTVTNASVYLSEVSNPSNPVSDYLSGGAGAYRSNSSGSNKEFASLVVAPGISIENSSLDMKHLPVSFFSNTEVSDVNIVFYVIAFGGDALDKIYSSAVRIGAIEDLPVRR